jgi:hypothetical protein
MPAYDKHEVKVTVGETAIEVDPDHVRMDKTDEIRWISTNGKPFLIGFDDAACLGENDYSFAQAGEWRKLSPNAILHQSYKYSVFSEDRTLVIDPTIEVTPVTKGGGGG